MHDHRPLLGCLLRGGCPFDQSAPRRPHGARGGAALYEARRDTPVRPRARALTRARSRDASDAPRRPPRRDDARALQPCSTPVLVDGAARFVECGGPHAVEEAVFAFLGGLNDTARVGCATEACVEAAPKKGATCSDGECTCAAGDWACARLVVEHAALPARWPPVSIKKKNVEPTPTERFQSIDRVGVGRHTRAPHVTTNLRERTWESWRDYCLRHGYAFFPLDLSNDHWAAYSDDLKVELDYYLKVRSGHWHKIFLLRRLLDADCFDFYVVVDDDVVVTAPSVQLHVILEDLPPDYLGAGADENYHHHAQSQIGGGYSFNTGLLATRGGAHSKLLEAAWLEPFRKMVIIAHG